MHIWVCLGGRGYPQGALNMGYHGIWFGKDSDKVTLPHSTVGTSLLHLFAYISEGQYTDQIKIFGISTIINHRSGLRRASSDQRRKHMAQHVTGWSTIIRRKHSFVSISLISLSFTNLSILICAKWPSLSGRLP